MLRSRVFIVLVVAALAAAALAVAGCGSSNDSDASGSASTSTPSTQATTTTSEAPPAPDVTSAPKVSNAGDLEQKPKLAKPTGSPPPTLVAKDLVVGQGPAAAAGDTVSVRYVGVSFSNGQQFDASWDRGEPITFTLGNGEVIPGWDQGIAGMKVGGRRELVIPPDLGYGAAGKDPILPNETLVFVVDLENVG